jgi:hypothetical protein
MPLHATPPLWLCQKCGGRFIRHTLGEPVVLKMNYGMVAKLRCVVSLAVNQMHAKTSAQKLWCGVANHGSEPNAP